MWLARVKRLRFNILRIKFARRLIVGVIGLCYKGEGDFSEIHTTSDPYVHDGMFLDA